MADAWPDRVLKRKKPCPHDEAIWDGNTDWPGLVCKKCNKVVDEKDYEEGNNG